MEKVVTFLKENPTFFLATVEGEQPRVRPFGAISVYDGKLYICTNNQKDVYRQMQANPRIELSAVGSKGEWLRITADAVQDGRREAKAQILEENPSLKGMYNADDTIFEVLYLDNATATFYAFTAEPQTITF